MFVDISTYNKDIICDICNSRDTWIRVRKGKGSPSWYNYNNGKICHKCHQYITHKDKNHKKRSLI